MKLFKENFFFFNKNGFVEIKKLEDIQPGLLIINYIQDIKL